MKKKIMLLAAALMLFMGVVNASSINGDYKGNPIVKVMSNGKQLQSDEVPAMIYDGHTVVPISLLRQIGASVEWNQDNYSVDVKLGSLGDSQKPSINTELSSYIDVIRFVSFINEQALLTSQIIALKLLPSSLNSEQIQSASDLTSKIDTNRTNEFVQLIRSSASIPEDDKKTIESIGMYLSNINLALFEGDSKAALNKWIDMKNSINILSVKYDALLQKKSVSLSTNTSDSQIQPPLSTNPIKKEVPIDPSQKVETQQQLLTNEIPYTLNDAVIELGFTSASTITVEARSIAIELLEIRKTKKQTDYSVKDALRDLGLPPGSTPTLATLRQAIKLISLGQPVKQTQAPVQQPSQPTIAPQTTNDPVRQYPVQQPIVTVPEQPVTQTPSQPTVQPTVQVDPIVNQPQQQTKPVQQEPVKIDNTAKCQQIRDKYVLKLDYFNRNSNPFSGNTDPQRNLIIRDRDNELASSGCNQ